MALQHCTSDHVSSLCHQAHPASNNPPCFQNSQVANKILQNREGSNSTPKKRSSQIIKSSLPPSVSTSFDCKTATQTEEARSMRVSWQAKWCAFNNQPNQAWHYRHNTTSRAAMTASFNSESCLTCDKNGMVKTLARSAEPKHKRMPSGLIKTSTLSHPLPWYDQLHRSMAMMAPLSRHISVHPRSCGTLRFDCWQ